MSNSFPKDEHSTDDRSIKALVEIINRQAEEIETLQELIREQRERNKENLWLHKRTDQGPVDIGFGWDEIELRD